MDFIRGFKPKEHEKMSWHCAISLGMTLRSGFTLPWTNWQNTMDQAAGAVGNILICSFHCLSEGKQVG